MLVQACMIQLKAFFIKHRDHGAEWYWWNLENGTECVVQFHKKAYGSQFTYPEFAPMYAATLFDPVEV